MSGLLGSSVLEIFLGLFFIYFLISLICSSINELIAGLFKLRARDLERGIENLLCDPKVVVSVLNHPLIKAMGNNEAETLAVRRVAGERKARPSNSKMAASIPGMWAPWQGYAGKPSYIPSRTFSLALFDVLAPVQSGQISVARVRDEARVWATSKVLSTRQIGAAVLSLIDASQDPHKVLLSVDELKQWIADQAKVQGDNQTVQAISLAKSFAEIRHSLMSLPQSDLQCAALNLVDEAQGDIEAARKQVEQWYDDAMERVSGVYKRRIQVYLAVIGFVVSLLLGADTINIIRTLASNNDLRTLIASEATTTTSPGGTFALPAATNVFTQTVTVRSTGGMTQTTTVDRSPSITTVMGELDKFSAVFGYGDLVNEWQKANPKVKAGDTVGVSLWLAANRPGLLGLKLFGLLLTVGAVHLGAPFWFDLLQKIVNIRAAGQAPKKSTSADEAGSDKKGPQDKAT